MNGFLTLFVLQGSIWPWTRNLVNRELCYSFGACNVDKTVVTCGGAETITGKDVQSAGSYDRYTEGIVQEGVKRLESRAFTGCASMTKIMLPTSLEYIGGSCFQSTAIVRIYIPAKVTSMGPMIMYIDRKLQFIEVSPDNPSYCNDDQGALYNKEMTSLLMAPLSKTSLTIPDTVMTLEVGCCSYSALTKIVLPDSVVTVANKAFYLSGSLTKIHIGAGLADWDEGAISDCKKLSTITMSPDNTHFYLSESGVWGKITNEDPQEVSVLFIPPSTTSLTLGANVAVIGSMTLQMLSSVTLLVLEGDKIGTTPDGQVLVKDSEVKACIGGAVEVDMSDWINVTVIGESAFRQCTSLVSIKLVNTITTIDGYAFHSCRSLTTFDFNGAQVTTLGGLIWVSTNISTLVLPDSLTTFTDTQQLRNTPIICINLEKLTQIGQQSLEDCKHLKYVKLDSCVTIKTKAFQTCTSLEVVDFSANKVLKTIDSMAFSYCDSLGNITLPPSVTGLTASTMSYNPSLTSINFHEGECEYQSIGGVVYTAGGETIVMCPSGYVNITLEESTRHIASQAFCGCSNLFSVNMNDDLRSVNSSAFFECSKIQMIRIPAKIEFIGADAFQSCSKLSQILYCNTQDCPLWEGNPFPTNPKIYTKSSYAGDTFCGHQCIKILDDNCILPTQSFTYADCGGYAQHNLNVYLLAGLILQHM